MNQGNRRLVIASNNRGKLAEIRQLLDGLDFEVLPQSGFGIEGAEETGATFLENALLKARHAAAGAGLPAVGDDSGLEVAALDDRPGVRSARFAGPSATDDENIARLLGELEGVPEANRHARFRCVAVYVASTDDDAPLVAEASWPGQILERPRGTGGFGYDPVFFVPGLGKTVAEMTADEKNLVSHRGQAFRQLAVLIAERLRGEAT